MDELKVGELYNKVARATIEMIPQDWAKVYLYGEITEDVGKTYFYYYPVGEEKPVYFYDVQELFGIREDDFDELWLQLLDALRDLWNEFRIQGQEQWTSLTMIFDSEGDFKIDYDYEDLSEANDHQRMIVWKYTHLRLEPKNERDQAFLEQYLKNKQS